MHRLALVFALFLSLLGAAALAQGVDTPFDKKLFKDQKEEFKNAESALAEGDKWMEGNDPSKALPYYLKAQSFNPNYSILNYKIGQCYLSSAEPEKALNYFKQAHLLNPQVAPDIEFRIAYSHHIRSEWDQAIGWYRRYQKTLRSVLEKKNQGVVQPQIDLMDKRVRECENGKKFMADTARVWIDNLGPAVNTEYPEYSVNISADASTMYFTSRRPGSTGVVVPKEKFHEGVVYMEDIYRTERRPDGSWGAPVQLGKPINTEGHDATVALAPDGQTILIYKHDNGGDIYECKLQGLEWSKPRSMGSNINTKYHESSASFSPDMKRLYFCSDKPENNLGGSDIFYCDWDEKKQDWGPAMNLSAMINTPYNEEAVFIHPDGVTLYFSSEGHNSMGGYDVFTSTFDPRKNTWSEPRNLGYPINGPGNDMGIVVSASGRRGFFDAEEHGGFGKEDIYQITFLGPEKPVQLVGEDLLLSTLAKPTRERLIEPPVEITMSRATLLKGIVLDKRTKKPLEAEIELIDNTEGKAVAVFTSNSSTGRFLVSLPAGRNYGIAVKKTGYLFHSENFDVADTAAYQEVYKEVLLQDLSIGASIVLRNVFFDVDKATLRPESKTELNRAAQLMKDNPTLSVEIGGHTDDVGSDSYNQQLSERRAQSVVDYLVSQGVPKTRLRAKGYGEAVPMADNKTPEGRQQNRRTEFKVATW